MEVHQTIINSTPALAAAIRTMDGAKWAPACIPDLHGAALVPMYQVQANSGCAEAEAAAAATINVIERLRRLPAAYGEWSIFDAPAYFDLTVPQCDSLLRVVERVRTVHVVFFVDWLLPSLRQAATDWLREFVPAYAERRREVADIVHFYRDVQPAMVEQWRELTTVIQQARAILSEDVGFWVANGAQEERERWQRWWGRPPAAGLDSALTPNLSQVPTLTLTMDFPLPTHRQPDRFRRLRANRDRQRWRKGYRVNL
jgi:hypothetical protein